MLKPFDPKIKSVFTLWFVRQPSEVKDNVIKALTKSN